jgi:hypothetical protein
LSHQKKDWQTSFPAAVWWREDVDIHPGDRSQIGRRPTEPPPLVDLEEFLAEISRPLVTVAPRLDDLMRRYRHYTDSTGDVFHLIRSSCNIGMRLIKAGPAAERKARGQRAVILAQTALAHAGTDLFAWGLLSDALVEAGRFRDAELVGWERIRRFPEDVQGRTRLAGHLAGPLDQTEEAADLLRETIRQFFDDPFARTQLATVLADGLKAPEQAREVLQAAIDDGISDDATDSLLRKLDQGRPLGARGRAAPIRVEADESSLSLPAAEGRRLLFRFETGQVGADEVQAFVDSRGTDAYLAYVGERIEILNQPLMTGFAISFERALRAADPSALRAMIAQARPMERAVIDQAIALSDGRVTRFGEGDSDLSRLAKTAPLAKTLDQLGDGREDARKSMLRDIAGSFLGLGAGLGFSIAA